MKKPEEVMRVQTKMSLKPMGAEGAVRRRLRRAGRACSRWAAGAKTQPARGRPEANSHPAGGLGAGGERAVHERAERPLMVFHPERRPPL